MSTQAPCPPRRRVQVLPVKQRAADDVIHGRSPPQVLPGDGRLRQIMAAVTWGPGCHGRHGRDRLERMRLGGDANPAASRCRGIQNRPAESSAPQGSGFLTGKYLPGRWLPGPAHVRQISHPKATKLNATLLASEITASGPGAWSDSVTRPAAPRAFMGWRRGHASRGPWLSCVHSHDPSAGRSDRRAVFPRRRPPRPLRSSPHPPLIRPTQGDAAPDPVSTMDEPSVAR